MGRGSSRTAETVLGDSSGTSEAVALAPLSHVCGATCGQESKDSVVASIKKGVREGGPQEGVTPLTSGEFPL